MKHDQVAEAQADLKICLYLWPRSVPVHLLAARAARSAGDLETAEAHLNQCLRLEPTEKADVQLEFLLMRVQTGEEDVVARDLMAYVDNKHPDSSLILETLTRAYLDKLRYGPALATLDRWVNEAPDTAAPYQWRGWVLERMDDPAGSMKDYQRAIELDPGLDAVRIQMAELALERNDPPAALPHLQQLSKKFPDRPDIMALSGRCCYLRGETNEARRLLEGAVKKRPEDTNVLITLAKLEMLEDRPAEAEQWVRRAMKADPTDAEAQHTFVAILQHQGRQEEAAAAELECEKNKATLRQVARLLQEQAIHPATDPNALYQIGTLFLRGRQDHVGEYWLRRALELDPAHQPTLQALADYYESKGDKDQAAAVRRRLEAAEPKHAP